VSRGLDKRLQRSMTRWERICDNLGLDPLQADPASLKILGPLGYTGEVETTCRALGCKIVMAGQKPHCGRHEELRTRILGRTQTVRRVE
jgi:hypothetical protein